jgi:hypothetical protein
MDTRYPRHSAKDRKKDAKHRKKYRRHKHNPCPHAPRQLDSTTELTGVFFKHRGRKRHNNWGARFRWTEVNTDSDGFPLIVLRYAVEIDESANGTDWFLSSRHNVPAKDDFDANHSDHLRVFHIHGNLAYRYRVRAISANCKADWSAYYVLGTPEDAPPAPFDVEILRASHGIRVRWHADMDNDDDEIFTQDIAYFVGQLWINPDFGPELNFTATNAGDLFTTGSAHGMSDGDPLMLSGTVGALNLPAGIRPWKVYRADVQSSTTFKLVGFQTLAPITLTSDGDGVAHIGLVKAARHVHKHHHIYRLDTEDFDEDTRFYGRVRSHSDHRSKSDWVPATAPDGNDDPGATPTGRRPAWHRHVFVFSFLDPVGVGLYKRPTRADDDYKIRRVTASFHKAGTGDDTKFDIKINAGTFVFDEDFSKMVNVADGTRDGSSKQMVNDVIERGDHIRVKCEQLATTPPEFGTIHVICDRLREGPTSDSGGGGGE